MDITYKDYKVYKPSRLPTLKPDELGTLKGDMTPTQAKRFLECYELLIHQPNTKSGFSVTLLEKTNMLESQWAYHNKKASILMSLSTPFYRV